MIKISLLGYEDFSTSAAPYNSLKQQQFDKAVLGNVKPSPVLDDNGQKLYTLDAQGLKVMYNKSYKPEDIYNWSFSLYTEVNDNILNKTTSYRLTRCNKKTVVFQQLSLSLY